MAVDVTDTENGRRVMRSQKIKRGWCEGGQIIGTKIQLDGRNKNWCSIAE